MGGAVIMACSDSSENGTPSSPRKQAARTAKACSESSILHRQPGGDRRAVDRLRNGTHLELLPRFARRSVHSASGSDVDAKLIVRTGRLDVNPATRTVILEPLRSTLRCRSGSGGPPP